MEFLLFLLLGLAVFIPLGGNARLVAMVVYVVLMLLLLLGVGSGFNLGSHFNFR